MLLLLLRAQERDRAGDRPRLRDHALVGVAAGIVMLFLQTKGLLLLAAAAAFTLFAVGGRRGVRAAAALAGGAAVVVAPLLLVWRPSVLVREWFIVPLDGQLPRSHGRVAVARRRLPAGRRRDGGDRDPPARSAADRGRGRAGARWSPACCTTWSATTSR